MYSLDIKTGKENWKVKTGGSVCFPPVFKDGLGYAQSHDRNLYIFDLLDGAIRDTIIGDYWMCGIPSIAHNHIYYPDWGGNLSSYDLEAHENEWTFHTGSYSQRYTCPSISDSIAYFVASDSILHAIDLANGNEIMSFKAGDKITRSPAIAGNLLALTTHHSHFYVIDKNSGKILWDYGSTGATNSHPIIITDVVYFGSGNGTLSAFEIQSGEKLWEIKLEAAINTPFFYENALYFSSGKFVYRVD
jgi:outer membrane protein assembly factor BamB